MKRLNKILCLIVILLFACVCFGATTIALAEEPIEEVAIEEVQEPTEEQEEPTENKIAEKVAELVVKVNGLAESDFFTQKVLPFIISVGGALLAGLVVLLPYLRKRTQFKVIQTAYSKLAEETENLKKLLSSTDVGEIKEIIKSLFESELQELANALKKDGAFYNETIAIQKTIMAKLDNLTNGALNAWQSSKEAVKCLTNNAEMSTLASYEKVNSALKGYIKEIKGEEAEEIIKQLEA